METPSIYKLSLSDFEKYMDFFPKLEAKNLNNYFRPWTDKCPQDEESKSSNKEETKQLVSSAPSAESEAGTSSGESCCLTAKSSARARRFRRKSSQPLRSAKPNDPSFRGVTVSVQTHLARRKRSKRWQTQLLIKSYFSVSRMRGCKLSRSFRTRRCGGREYYQESSSDSESQRQEPCLEKRDNNLKPPQQRMQLTTSFISPQRPLYLLGFSGKQCASCFTRRTPLWRDAEDGTPLCNACGIRYKKYRIRCGGCWLIPRKDGKAYSNCIRCGQEFRVAVVRKSLKQ